MCNKNNIKLTLSLFGEGFICLPKMVNAVLWKGVSYAKTH